MLMWITGNDLIYREAVICQSPESRSALWVKAISRVFYAESVRQFVYNAFGVKKYLQTYTQVARLRR